MLDYGEIKNKLLLYYSKEEIVEKVMQFIISIDNFGDEDTTITNVLDLLLDTLFKN